MRQNILAVYKNGVFHPLTPLDLPEGAIVYIEIVEMLGDIEDYTEEDLLLLKESKLKNLEKE